MTSTPPSPPTTWTLSSPHPTARLHSIVSHASTLFQAIYTPSLHSSTGQHYQCHLLSPSSSVSPLLIARIRLPTDPSPPLTTITELATMRALHDYGVPIPTVYFHAAAGSKEAEEAGAEYMLMEYIPGNTLEAALSVEDGTMMGFWKLPTETRKMIIMQWTSIIIKVHSLTFPLIGGIFPRGSIGPLSFGGPWDNAASYHLAAVQAAFAEERSWETYAFMRLCTEKPVLSDAKKGCWGLVHGDLGAVNLLVDAEWNIVGVIDWEMAFAGPAEFAVAWPILIAGVPTGGPWKRGIEEARGWWVEGLGKLAYALEGGEVVEWMESWNLDAVVKRVLAERADEWVERVRRDWKKIESAGEKAVQEKSDALLILFFLLFLFLSQLFLA